MHVFNQYQTKSTDRKVDTRTHPTEIKVYIITSDYLLSTRRRIQKTKKKNDSKNDARLILWGKNMV